MSDNKNVAHNWAHQTGQNCNGSHFYYDGATIYSYGSHFPIARLHKGVVLFTSRSHSVTTTRHKSITWGACHHLPIFTVSDVRRDPCAADVREYAAELKDLAMRLARARNTDFAMSCYLRKIDEANSFCHHFGFKTRFARIDGAQMEKLKAKAAKSAIRERKQHAARKAKEERDAAVVIAEWQQGKRDNIPFRIETVYLRVRLESDGNGLTGEKSLQTSKGARVPLAEAERAFRFIVKHRETGWHRNGETFAIGDFQLDKVGGDGIKIGCHFITWKIVDDFAKSQGWV